MSKENPPPPSKTTPLSKAPSSKGESAFAGLAGYLKQSARLGAYLGLRALASDSIALARIAEAMAVDEDGREAWSKASDAQKGTWRARARASLIGLDTYLRGLGR